MNHFKIDPSHTSASNSMKGKHVGIVGESHIWDGPLDQTGRLHGKGASNGITGMRLKHAGVPYKPLNAVLCAQGHK